MNILFIGDIVGRPGRDIVAKWLPRLREQYALDAVVANAENVAGGLGATPATMDELFRLGIDGLTLGNHTWRKKELVGALDGIKGVVRPANYPDGVPGVGSAEVVLADGRSFGLVSVVGRVFMPACDCPFVRAHAEVERLRATVSVVLVDVHAEATSEKIALGWYLDGKCSAVLGTHTHVPTADERVLPRGTAYITDVGMCGPCDSVIGIDADRAVHKFLTGLPDEYRLAKGRCCLCAVVVEADGATGRAASIRRVFHTSDE